MNRRPGAAEVEGGTVGGEPGAPTAREGAALLVAGVGFGIVLMKSEVASWYRIFEMFRFGSFHLYGVIGSAVATGALGVALLRRWAPGSAATAPLEIPRKERTPWFARYALGGFAFGLGWGLLGACPGPIFAWIGAGAPIYLVPLAAALAGTWTYGVVRDRLPH